MLAVSPVRSSGSISVSMRAGAVAFTSRPKRAISAQNGPNRAAGVEASPIPPAARFASRSRGSERAERRHALVLEGPLPAVGLIQVRAQERQVCGAQAVGGRAGLVPVGVEERRGAHLVES